MQGSFDTYQLKDKVAFITGAGAGIGAASAEELARHGCKVALVGRTKEKLDKMEKKIGSQQACSIACDVSKPEQVERAIEECVRRFGRLDVVFANAGINGVWAPLEDLNVEEWHKTIETNLSGTFYTIKYAVPHLKRAGGGSIIVCSSINGTRQFSNVGASAYATSKGGQVAMAKMAALELAKHGIRVNTVCPGHIKTEINDKTEKRNIEKEMEQAVYPGKEHPIPLTHGQGAEPQQIAHAVAYLASAASAFVTGTEIFIDGGQTLLKG